MNAEDADRRLHWMRLAVELGQADDFRALLDAEREGRADDARLAYWSGEARKVGQHDDFAALLEDVRREGAEARR